jgi:hypothetical protein
MEEELFLLDLGLNNMMAKIELENTTCGLKHSSEDPAENHKAVDYICQRLGNKDIDSEDQEIRIPVCNECIEALHDENWILVFCVYCFKSQWICRRLAKKKYPKGNLIYWLDVCPFCSEVSDKYNGEDIDE